MIDDICGFGLPSIPTTSPQTYYEQLKAQYPQITLKEAFINDLFPPDKIYKPDTIFAINL